MSATTPLSTASYLLPALADATVGDAMHPGILSCDPDTPLVEVARIMATHHVHSVAVIGISHTDPEGPVWGLISDLDLLRIGVRESESATAGTLAMVPLVSVERTTPLREAAEVMLRSGTSHVVVIEPGSERPIGILSSLDVAGVLAWGAA